MKINIKIVNVISKNNFFKLVIEWNGVSTPIRGLEITNHKI
mgnify:FL=1